MNDALGLVLVIPSFLDQGFIVVSFIFPLQFLHFFVAVPIFRLRIYEVKRRHHWTWHVFRWTFHAHI